MSLKYALIDEWGVVTGVGARPGAHGARNGTACLLLDRGAPSRRARPLHHPLRALLGGRGAERPGGGARGGQVYGLIPTKLLLGNKNYHTTGSY